MSDIKYPGIPTTTDGAGNVVWVESHITDGSCAYPITSSTTMGVGYNLEVANGKEHGLGVFIKKEDGSRQDVSYIDGKPAGGEKGATLQQLLERGEGAAADGGRDGVGGNDAAADGAASWEDWSLA